MISFCQDLSISYEYHVYENKTIKKIAHTRNGSDYSQKTYSKTNKLHVVSKNVAHPKPTPVNKGINVTDNCKLLTLSPKNKGRHQRTVSDHVEMKVMQAA